MANPIVEQINTELNSLQKELEQFKETVSYLNNAKKVVKDAVLKVNHSEAHLNDKVEDLKKTYDSFIKLNEAISAIIAKIDTVNFPDRLDSIEKTVKETTTILNNTRKETIDELQKAAQVITKADFDGRFKKLQSTIDVSVNSSGDIVKSIEKQKYQEKIDKFENNIIRKLNDVEKSIGDTLDEAINELEENTEKIAKETAKSIHSLNLPTRIDKLDANIAGIMAAIQSIQSRLDNVERNISDKMRDLSDKQKEEMQSMKSFMNASAKKQQTNAYITGALLVIGIIAIIILCKN
jgi:chromosome segregation ATPase